MKIATFNANSIRARMAIVLDWLAKEKPDVLCLQETKVQDPDFPNEPLEAAGYHVVYRGEKAYNGVAIVSKQKPAAVRFGLDDGQQPDETRLIAAKVGGVHILNTYVPQGREIDHAMYGYKVAWFQRVRDYLDRHHSPRQRLVWLGDMNIAPEPIDVHDPASKEDHVCFHKDAREAFVTTRAWGFEDVFRKHHPEPEQYTFFDYRMRGAVTRGHGWRIDHILATRRLARKSSDCFIDLKPRLAPKPSDHTFLVAEFNV
ncbi:MAG: exodeoxyribonuclease III [Kiritimatiellae bacterium]|nr:exodeoxyribonuclease III [Kiritimatiellia bacterium]